MLGQNLVPGLGHLGQHEGEDWPAVADVQTREEIQDHRG